MFGSAMLEVGIGLVIVYIVFALACSTVSEQISQFLGLRAQNLWDSICALTGDRDGVGAAKDLYNHPLVRGLASKGGSSLSAEADHPVDRPMPSYIPADVFSLALHDVWKSQPVVKGGATDELAKALEPIFASAGATVSKTSTGDDADKARKNIEVWYDAAMERSSGWYKRKVQVIIFAIAAILVTASNADTVMIANKLMNNPAMRAAAVSKAQSVSEAGVGSVDPNKTPEVSNMLGWTQPEDGGESTNPESDNSVPQDWGSWIAKIFGLLITAFAASLGAPFWFQMLQNLLAAKKELGGGGSGAPATGQGQAAATKVNRIGGQP